MNNAQWAPWPISLLAARGKAPQPMLHKRRPIYRQYAQLPFNRPRVVNRDSWSRTGCALQGCFKAFVAARPRSSLGQALPLRAKRIRQFVCWQAGSHRSTGSHRRATQLLLQANTPAFEWLPGVGEWWCQKRRSPAVAGGASNYRCATKSVQREHRHIMMERVELVHAQTHAWLVVQLDRNIQ